MGTKFLKVLAMCGMALMISGCATKSALSPKDTVSKDGFNEGPDFVAPGGVGLTESGGVGVSMQTAGGLPSERDEAFLKGLKGDVYEAVKDQAPSIAVHFEFDQSAIRSSDREALRQFAAQSHGDGRFVVIGRCDWFGTREYNLGLGERRAEAVMNYLKSCGFSNPIEILSRSNLDAMQGVSREESWRDRSGSVYQIPETHIKPSESL